MRESRAEIGKANLLLRPGRSARQKLLPAPPKTEKPPPRPKTPMGSFMLSPLPRLLHLDRQQRTVRLVPAILHIFNALGVLRMRVPGNPAERQHVIPAN